jgi:DNA polymerase-4
MPEKYLKQQPKEFSTIYIDMNSFFASVEQFYNPKLRGRPVAVATAQSSGGSIIAASIEAKRFGIKTGMKTAEARLKCPEITIVSDSPNNYRAIHRQIMAILHNTPCYVRPKSIDEAYLKVPSYMQTKNKVLTLIKAIKSSLFKHYNEYILCSVGVASNVWLAKMGSNSQKPNGLVVLTSRDYEAFYKTLKLTDLTGINKRMAERLYAIGIDSPTSFYGASWKFLHNKLGISGGKWYLRMRGYEVDAEPVKANKSISHQITTIPNPPSTLVEVTTYINKISINLGKRLRYNNLAAKGISLCIYYIDGNYWVNEFCNTQAIRSDYEIIMLSKMLLKKLTNLPRPVRKLTITLSNLLDDQQMTLPLNSAMHKYLSLSYAVDQINDKYGKNTIMPMRSFDAKHVDLNRVGFAGDLLQESANPTDNNNYK